MTTFGDLRDEVKIRVNIAASAAEPSDPEILNMVIGAFRTAIGSFSPVFELEVVPDENVIDLSTELDTLETITRIHYVSGSSDILMDHEWRRNTLGLKIRDYSKINDFGDGVMVWFSKGYALSTATETTNFITSCLFGPDWLDEFILNEASRLTLMHMLNIHASQGADNLGSMFRVQQDAAELMKIQMVAMRNEFFADMEDQKQQRAFYAPPVRRNPLSGMKINGYVRNRLAPASSWGYGGYSDRRYSN